MKYIKMFEAFESRQLAKTLAFVRKQDREDFLQSVKSICAKIDAPMSSLSDEFFEYLPYKKALAKRSDVERPQCPSCQGTGKTEKAWGRGTRMVKCVRCEGAGTVDPEAKVKYIKFWFDSEGKYVGTTAVDGRYHPDAKDTANYVKKDITEDVRNLSAAEIKSKYGIVNGETKIYVQEFKGTGWSNRNSRKSQLGVAFIDRDGKFYMVSGNSGLDYGSPVGRKWKDYGRYAFNMKSQLGEDYNAGAKVYIMTDVVEQQDVYWNVPVVIDKNYYDKSVSGFYLSPSMDKAFLKDAHFAIVFDYDAFAYGGKEWNPVSITKGDRKAARKGATALMSNEDIKSANIERYIKKISSMDLSEGIGRIVTKIPMIFGGDLALYFIYTERNFSRFKNIMSDVYDFMTAESDDERARINQRLSERIRDAREEVASTKKRMEARLADIRGYASESEKKSKLLAKLDEIGKSINRKLLQGKMESIEDMEIMLMKAIGIHSALRSDRFSLEYYLRTMISDLGSTSWRSDTSSYDAFQGIRDAEVDGQIAKLNLISNVIDRL